MHRKRGLLFRQGAASGVASPKGLALTLLAGLTLLLVVFLWLTGGVDSGQVTAQFADDDEGAEEAFPEVSQTGKDGPFETLVAGGVKILGQYSAELRDGLWLRLSPSGEILVQGSYLRGRPEGEWTIFYEGSGQMKESGSYQSGLAVGVWEMYYPNGELFEIIEFKEGKQDGSWKMFHSDGSLADDMTWQAGKQVGTEVNYDRSGRVVATGAYADHRPIGTWTCFEEDGRERAISAPSKRLTPREACGFGASPDEPVLEGAGSSF